MQTLNPRNRFKQGPNAKAHADLVTKEHLMEALIASLAEMEVRMPSPDNPAKAWDNGCRMMGARQFIDIFLNLVEEEKAFQKPDSKSLKPEINVFKKD